ncbi:hypothetical protein IU500_19490 [Nocardia terpenica]|uniref:Transport acessory protein MmpS n=1 Tax=Nocardia terpenica TaxID=455432 RepID=A0A164PTK5_9NOCA|nr:MmpS family transport accessory protein [Nocardia terpenica]KZM76048.1 hypothetical protein AWN90_17280 [Nocardia terpenica]MBF6061977.1 hypothetical protein [Nocardia terpenica]MBF6106223.1 hypothetical protein [Nocardia terpenica]MBF6110397.1 hypothetical protein [Nocardia terpenica]MBF6120766.1 hypothetical protein [Nocardia terpenica]
MRRAWVYVVVVVTLGAAGGFIAHLRLSEIPDLAIGHSNPPPSLGRPVDKVIDYQVDGPANASASLSFLDQNGAVQTVQATLPWRTSLHTHKLTLSTGLIAQSTADRVSCRIVINGEVRDTQSSDEPSAAVNCKVLVS